MSYSQTLTTMGRVEYRVEEMKPHQIIETKWVLMYLALIRRSGSTGLILL